MVLTSVHDLDARQPGAIDFWMQKEELAGELCGCVLVFMMYRNCTTYQQPKKTLEHVQPVEACPADAFLLKEPW